MNGGLIMPKQDRLVDTAISLVQMPNTGAAIVWVSSTGYGNLGWVKSGLDQVEHVRTALDSEVGCSNPGSGCDVVDSD